VRSPAVPLPAADSVPPRDTLKTPFAQAERPASPELKGGRWVWNRETLAVTGALTLPELLVEAPGVSFVRSSYLLAPTALSWYGEPGRVRVYYDGIELDALDPRGGGNLDLATIPIWTLEEVALERAAGELRVHLRTWRVDRTTPQTRTDVFTGAEQLNLYRGFYGRRFDSGFGLQIAGQQFSMTNSLTGADGDGLAGFVRMGLARGAWAVDAVAMPSGRSRSATRRFVRSGAPDDAAIGAFDGRDALGYLRVAYRTPEQEGLWAQAIGAAYSYIESDSAAASGTTPDTDSTVHQTQWVAAAGIRRGALRLSATGRARIQAGELRFSPMVRAAWERERLDVSGAVETAGPDSTFRADLLARVQLLHWLHVAGGVSRHAPAEEAAGGPARLSTRGEVGLRWRGRWLTAGVVQRSEARVVGFPVYDSDYGPATIAASTGLFYGLGGPIWGPFSLEWRIHDWGDELLYRPTVESRAELRAETTLSKWLRRGTFHLRSSFLHEYRSDLRAPDGLGGLELAKGASAFSLLLDIRIGTAHIFFHNRNMTGMVYETVPGYLMPRLTQQYGIRWEFWN
jgi:hypothetical protein